MTAHCLSEKDRMDYVNSVFLQNRVGRNFENLIASTDSEAVIISSL
jgi:hypothetical protein